MREMFIFVLGMFLWMAPLNVIAVTAATNANTTAAPNNQEYVITQKDNKGNVVGTYRINVYSNSKPLTPQQTQEMMEQLEKQQHQFQESFNKLMSETLQTFNATFPGMMVHSSIPFFPMIQPVVVIHEKCPESNSKPPKSN